MATTPFTAFAQSQSDPYLNVGRFQQDPTFDWSQTQVIAGPNGYLENNPETAWARYLQGNYGIGLADQSPYATFVRNQYQNARRGFEASVPDDPTLIFQDYLSRTMPNYAQMFAALTPNMRGENVSRYGGPVRWIGDI